MTNYSDPHVSLDDNGITIHRYRFPSGDKSIAYGAIQSVEVVPLNVLARWRIWGGSMTHWFHLDTGRPKKKRAIVLDLGSGPMPVVTPNDLDTVVAQLREKLAADRFKTSDN